SPPSRTARSSLTHREHRLQIVTGVDLEGDHRLRPAHARQLGELAGDHLGQRVLLAQAQDGHEVPLAGDRVGLGHSLYAGQLAAERGQRRAFSLDEDDGVGHALWVSPGSSTTTCELVCDSTSALNAWASASIAGK